MDESACRERHFGHGSEVTRAFGLDNRRRIARDANVLSTVEAARHPIESIPEECQPFDVSRYRCEACGSSIAVRTHDRRGRAVIPLTVGYGHPIYASPVNGGIPARDRPRNRD